jgi:hypothetical protein
MQNQKCLSFRILEKISFIELKLTRIFLSIKIIVNKIFMRILHSGSALAFQARGAGSIPAIRSCAIKTLIRSWYKTFQISGGCSQVVKAVDCDSTIRGFNSRHSPIFLTTKFYFLKTFNFLSKKKFL